MENTFVYRFFKGTWGIYVSLTAELVPYADASEKAIEVIPNVHLDIEAPHLLISEHDYLILGVTLVRSQLEEWINKNHSITIRVIKVTITLTDYQPEGLTCALSGWIAQELGLEYSPPEVYFSKEENHYIFPFSAI
ncbi:MAG: hypothetical protein ABI947_29550 [Chloroflexota bacterium]